MEHIYNQPQFGQNWFQPESAELFRRVVQSAHDGAKFVEIGSWKGKSSSYMAVEIANSGKQIEFNCIDTWEGSVEHQGMPDLENLYEVFISNMTPVEKYYTPIRKTSSSASRLYKKESLDFIFIDASHEYEDVKEDIKLWLPKLKKGGIISGDDYSNPGFPGVKQAVDEHFGADVVASHFTWEYTKK